MNKRNLLNKDIRLPQDYLKNDCDISTSIGSFSLKCWLEQQGFDTDILGEPSSIAMYNGTTGEIDDVLNIDVGNGTTISSFVNNDPLGTATMAGWGTSAFRGNEQSFFGTGFFVPNGRLETNLGWVDLSVGNYATFTAGGNGGVEALIESGDALNSSILSVIPSDVSIDFNSIIVLNINASGQLSLPLTPAFQDDVAAGAGGLQAGDVYQTTGTGAPPLDAAGILMIKQ